MTSKWFTQFTGQTDRTFGSNAYWFDSIHSTVNISDDSKVFVRIEKKSDEDEVIRYQYDNHLGSACLELDVAGLIISYEEYHPFGTTSYRSGANEIDVSLKRYKYCGKERDEETGLYYYGMRYYAAWLCRFINVDPLQFKYSYYTPFQYAGNKPITYIDLDGMEEADPKKKKHGLFYFSITNLDAAINIGLPSKGSTNISTNVVRFSTRIGLQENNQKEGSEVNAFRHVLWQAAITVEFGTEIAMKCGDAHEKNPYAVGDSYTYFFKTLSEADETIDLLNNIIGRYIGQSNPNANMQELALIIIDYYENNGLYTAREEYDETGKIIGYNVVFSNISEVKSKEAKEILNTLNSDGYTKSEQIKVTKEKMAKQNSKVILSVPQ